MPNIYSYESASQFLADCYAFKKSKNPSFSIRAWASRLSLKTHVPLHLVLSGKRKIPKKYIPLFVRDLGLDEKQANFFELLVDYSRTSDLDLRRNYAIRLNELKPISQSENVFYELESHRFVEDPIHTAILEMTDLVDFESEPRWIQRRLRVKVSLLTIKDTIDRLIKLELLKWIDGRLVKTHKSLTTPQDHVAESVQEYHKRICGWAQDQVDKQDVKKRQYDSMSFNLKSDSVAMMKTEIREFVMKLVDKYEADELEGEETYQFSTQLFSLTKNGVRT